MRRPRLRGVEVQAQSCGRKACENDAMAFWQSRMTTDGQRADPVQLTDLTQLAKDIRHAAAAATTPIATIAAFAALTASAASAAEGHGHLRAGRLADAQGRDYAGKRPG